MSSLKLNKFCDKVCVMVFMQVILIGKYLYSGWSVLERKCWCDLSQCGCFRDEMWVREHFVGSKYSMDRGGWGRREDVCARDTVVNYQMKKLKPIT